MRLGRVELSGLTRRPDRALGVAASVIFHLAVLAGLGLGARTAFKWRQAEDDIQVRLVRMSDLRPRPTPPRAATAPAAAVIRPHETRSPPPPSSPAPFLVPPAPPAAAPAPPAAPAPNRAPLLGIGEAMQKVLGCSDSARAGMSEAQRAVCDRRTAEEVRLAKQLPLNIPPDKKRAWDVEMWKRHRPIGDPMVPCASTGPGSNYGFACIPDKVKPPPASDD